MIEVVGLTKLYGNKKAIDTIDFNVDEGEIVGLLGLNGAGKSTILKVLASYLSPTSGTVQIGGNRLGEESDEIRKICGYLPDRPPLYDEMTVESYLKFVCRVKGVPSSLIQTKVDLVMASTNLNEVSDQLLSQISHGFRQRVGIAQAIAHEPKVIILDEPIKGLDPVQIIEMRDLILSLKGKYTVILSSHILSEMTKTCDRILIIDKGRLVAEGTEQHLMNNLGSHMLIKAVFRGSVQGFSEKLSALDGVDKVDFVDNSGVISLSIEAQRDVRGQLAELVVNAGFELLELQKADSDLESLFIKIVNQEGNYA